MRNTGKAFRAFVCGKTDVIAIGEPLVRAHGQACPQERGGCGASHCSCHASRHHAAVRLLAWHRRAAFAAGLAWFENPGDFALSEGAHRARGMPFVRALCGLATGGCAGRRRLQNALHEPDFYCPIVRGKNRKSWMYAWLLRASCPRGGERVYHHRNRPRLAVRFASGGKASRRSTKNENSGLRRLRGNHDD